MIKIRKHRKEIIPMKKEILRTIVIIGLIIIFSLSATYAYLNLSISNNTSATGTGGCFKVAYDGQNITNASLISSTTYSGGTTTTVNLSKNASCKIYTQSSIYLYTNSSTTAPISNGSFKYRVEKAGTKVSEGVVTKVGGETLLATVPLTETETAYKIYLWIDSNTSNGTYHDKSYSGYVYAEATQTSSIK